MRFVKYSTWSRQKGSVLIISMIFILVFSALAVSMASLSGTNVQLANNHHKVNCALACAESGIEVMRYWLDKVSISGTTPSGQIFEEISAVFQSQLSALPNITPYDYNSSVIAVPAVTLNSQYNEAFSALITQIDSQTFQLDVTGVHDSTRRTIRTRYTLDVTGHTVFDFGIATKGPLSLAGNIQLEGLNISVESNVYIESENSNLALSIIGNSQIAGDVKIVNPIANVDLQGGQAGIGGETGQSAIDNHVLFGVPPTQFPEPNPAYFSDLATNIIDSTTDTSADAVFENVRIIAGTNPDFSGHVTLNGIVFIETPNILTFNGNTTVTGIIVGNGDYNDNSGTNKINFLGDVDSYPVTDLPDQPQFAQIREETGTFLLSPGFALSFGGSFSTLNGAIAGNGIDFFGNAGGTISGSVINYSDNEMTLSGNSDLLFNRSGVTDVPAGFVPEITLHYDPNSYSEIII
ncbi:MAG: pilus assembly PilX N-terminal domain-containing protein [Sedimentisphaerales bacterium]|nr:pilus assembly PilX N-terminal domain-containing protein [Sedimentisphaerales bacterium]